ncbi:hypothetical protein ACFQX6_06770 [Streptosporangium lutulentum]
MDRRHHLLLSPALLAIFALGTAACSPSTITSVSARAVVENISHGKATPAPDEQPKVYRDAYSKGYSYAAATAARRSASPTAGRTWTGRAGWTVTTPVTPTCADGPAESPPPPEALPVRPRTARTAKTARPSGQPLPLSHA